MDQAWMLGPMDECDCEVFLLLQWNFAKEETELKQKRRQPELKFI